MATNIKSNLIYSVLGVFCQIIFPLVTYPYVTRILGLANLGEYNFYTSTVAFVTLFSGFGISLFGTKEIGKYRNNKEKYSQVFVELFTLNFMMCVLAYLLLFGLASFSTSYQNSKLLAVTSIMILGNTIGAEYLFVALEKQKYLLIRNVLFKAVSVICIFIFVKNENDLMLYAVISVISTVGLSITNIFNYRAEIAWRSINFKKIRLCIYIIPLSQVFLMDWLIHYYGMMDITLLGNIDSVESVGYYSTASKIYALTYSVLASTAIPLLPRAAYYIENGEFVIYKKMIQKCYDIYLLIIVFCSFILFYFSKDIICLIAGQEFAPASLTLRLFAFTLFFSSFCNFFIFQILYPYNKTKIVLIAQVLSIVINIALNLVLVPQYSYNGSAAAFLLSHLIMFAIMMVYGRFVMPKFSGKLDFLKELVGIAICFAISYMLNKMGLYFIFSIVFCSIFFIVVQLGFKNNTIMYLKDIVVNKLIKILE